MARSKNVKQKDLKCPTRSHPISLAGAMLSRLMLTVPAIAAALFLGMCIYRYAENLPWSDSFLNAAMLLGGMGPVNPIQTEIGKWLAGSYALFAGLVFMVIAGIVIGPVLHVALHKFHLDDTDAEEGK